MAPNGVHFPFDIHTVCFQLSLFASLFDITVRRLGEIAYSRHGYSTTTDVDDDSAGDDYICVQLFLQGAQGCLHGNLPSQVPFSGLLY